MKYYKFTDRLKLTYILPVDKVYLVRIPPDTINPSRVCITGLDHPYPTEFGVVSELQVIDEAELAQYVERMTGEIPVKKIARGANATT